MLYTFMVTWQVYKLCTHSSLWVSTNFYTYPFFVGPLSTHIKALKLCLSVNFHQEPDFQDIGLKKVQNALKCIRQESGWEQGLGTQEMQGLQSSGPWVAPKVRNQYIHVKCMSKNIIVSQCQMWKSCTQQVRRMWCHTVFTVMLHACSMSHICCMFHLCHVSGYFMSELYQATYVMFQAIYVMFQALYSNCNFLIQGCVDCYNTRACCLPARQPPSHAHLARYHPDIVSASPHQRDGRFPSLSKGLIPACEGSWA